MTCSRKNQLLHLVCYTLLIICTPVLTQGFDTVTPDLQYDKNIEASGLRGVPLKTQQMNMILPSRSIDSEKMEAKAIVDGPYHFSIQSREWGPHAHFLGINIEDNAWVSSCHSTTHKYICTQQGSDSITVFHTKDGIAWDYVTLTYGADVNYPDINTGSGYIYISCVYTYDCHPGIIRSSHINNIVDWEPMIYWGGHSDIRTTSVGSPTHQAVCFGFHSYGEPEIHYFHTTSYPDNFMETIAYNPYSSTQRDVEMDGAFDSGTNYIYTANHYFDIALNKYQGRVVVYELDSTSLTRVMSEKVAWSDTSSNENLTIHGTYDKFTVAYQYYEAATHNLYARTYEDFGAYKIPLGHVADNTASDMYPRVYHDQYSDVKYFVYLKLAGAGDVYTSIADADNAWTTIDEIILDSATSRHIYRGVCTTHTGTYGMRQLAAWIDERNDFHNVYYNLELTPNEGCPGQEIDISDWTPGSGESSFYGDTLINASDDIFEFSEISCWSGNSTSERVYRFTPPEDMSIQIDLIGSDFDTKMAIVAPCPVGSSFCMYSDDYDGDDAGFDCTEFQGGTTYSIIVTGNIELGYFSLNLDECTDVPCSELGCTVTMPSHNFGPGDTCYCDVTVCNPDVTPYSDIPVFVVLDVYGSYFFAPSFSGYDYYTETIPKGETIIPVLPSFAWPPGAGTASGIVWYAAMTNQAISELIGQFGIFEFGWHS
jgi:hypothetical protein